MTFVAVFRHVPRSTRGMIGMLCDRVGSVPPEDVARLEEARVTAKQGFEEVRDVFNTVAPGTDLKGVLVRAK